MHLNNIRILAISICLLQGICSAVHSQELDPSVFQPFPEKKLIVLEPAEDASEVSENVDETEEQTEASDLTFKVETLPGLTDEFQQAYQNVKVILPVVEPQKSSRSAITSESDTNILQKTNEADLLAANLNSAPVSSNTEFQKFVTRVASLPSPEIPDLTGKVQEYSPATPDHLRNNANDPSFFDSDSPQSISDSGNPTRHPLVWWKERIGQSLHPDNEGHIVEPNMLVYLALKNSPRIQAISQNPLIREAQVVEADSVFDPVGFVKSNYNDRHDPVGNTLVTGGPPFLDDHIWSGDAGIRKKTRTGARVELGQKLGFQNSNSRFFLPQDQGTSTLALNVTQPLLRGRGRYINQSQILIAQSNGQAAWATFENELQDELQLVAQAYWRLYYDRTLFLQKKRSVQRAIDILKILEGRSEFDSLPSQIARAKSAVATRRTDLANALRDIRNSETEIRRRVAEKDWSAAQKIELLPSELPSKEVIDIPLENIVRTALENRREIKEAMHRAKAAAIQQNVSENDLLPELSLLVGGYVSALNPESGVLQSWGDQFGNRPGYNAGIQFEMPYGNRAAQSQLTQRKHQLIRIKAEVEEQIQRVIAESQMAWRRIESALETRESALVAIEAADADLTQQTKRWENFGLAEGDMMEGQNATLLLNQVLDAQERLGAAELIYAQSELELKTAEIGLNRSMGTLLMHLNTPQIMENGVSEEPAVLAAETIPLDE